MSPHDMEMRAGASIHWLRLAVTWVIMNAATPGSRTLFTITVNSRAPSLSAPADNDISRSLELFLLHGPEYHFFTLLEIYWRLLRSSSDSEVVSLPDLSSGLGW